MKRAKVVRLVEDVIDAARIDRAPVTFRTLTVNFDNRTIVLDGRVIPVQTPAIDIPILSGDAVFIPSRGMERIG